jgi:hypothetical protein
MIKFTRGQINTVKIAVISDENLDGFYMRIGIFGVSKKVMPLSSKGTIVEYSAEDIDGRIGGHCGQYVIYDNIGRERKTGRILCSLNTTNITPSLQSLVVTMPKEFVADAPDGESGGGGNTDAGYTGPTYLGSFANWNGIPSTEDGFEDCPVDGTMILVEDGSDYRNEDEVETESLILHGVDAVGRTLSDTVNLELDGHAYVLQKGLIIGLAQILMLQRANIDLIPVYKSYHGKWILVYDAEGETYSKSNWIWERRVSDEADISAIVAEIAGKLDDTVKTVAEISAKVESLETNVEEVVREVVQDVAPQIIGDNIRVTVEEVVEENVSELIDEKIAKSVGDINDVLDDLNGEVI